jgi:hypothetical protein
MNSKLLREKRASDYAIMEDLQKRAAGEGRLMNAEELAQWDAADANFKNYTDQISRLKDGMRSTLKKEVLILWSRVLMQCQEMQGRL